MRRYAVAGVIVLALALSDAVAPTSGMPGAAGGDVAAFGPVALPAMRPGATSAVSVSVTNTGSTTWTSPPVYVAYHWYDSAGEVFIWDGVRTAFAGSVEPGETQVVAATVVAPMVPGPYFLSFELVREGVAWAGGPLHVPARVGGQRAAYFVGAGASAAAGATVDLPVTVTNTGAEAWSSSGSAPVALAYHVYDATGGLVVWDGARTWLAAPLLPGESRALTVGVTAPSVPGDYVVRVELVKEGVAWFWELGSPPADVPLRVGGAYGVIGAPDEAWAGAYSVATLDVTNTTRTTWVASGPTPVRLSYHVYAPSGVLETWDGLRSALPRDVPPGDRVTVRATLRAPSIAGDHLIAWDLVQEGVTWLSEQGVAPLRRPLSVRALPSSLRGAEWYRIPTSEPVVALTFDCGANADGAQKILDTLAAKGVPATFFMCGSFAGRYPDIARAIASRYPIGNHTATHPDLRTLDDASAVSEILGGESAIRDVTGTDPHPLFRFPYGASDARTIALANAYGYGGFRWTVDTLGWQGTSGGQSTATVTQRVLDALQPGEIVLMHVGSNPDDRSTLDADALAGIIDAIRARGYGFTTLPDHL